MSEERAVRSVDGVIGARVRSCRLAIGMSQERLAELLGITFQQVQKYEKGVNRVASSRLLDIARALETPVTTFFEGLDLTQNASEVDLSAALATPGAYELVRTYAGLTPKVRRQVIELIRVMQTGD